MNRILLCASFIAFFFLSSCKGKPNAVYELLEFRTEVKDHSADYSPEDWEKAMDKYMTICQELDEMQLTTEERLEIEKIKGEIAGYAATVAVQEVTDEIQNIADEVESFANGLNTTFMEPQNKR